MHDSAKAQGSLVEILRTSQAHKGRLLHYFPSEAASSAEAPSDDASTASRRRFDRKFADDEDDVQDDACGIRERGFFRAKGLSDRRRRSDIAAADLDHSLLTGLVSALYLAGPENQVVKPPDPAAGLYICPRASKSQAVKVSIPPDCLGAPRPRLPRLRRRGP